MSESTNQPQLPGERAPASASPTSKSAIRQQLRARLGALTAAQRHTRSLAACSLLGATPEFRAAHSIMLYMPMPDELDIATLALKAWQAGKTVAVPKVSWDQRRILPTEITSLQSGMTTTGVGVREPVGGKPVPVGELDLIIVPGLGFTDTGFRIGRGMGFYDRFLALPDFIGVSCGLAFDEQVVPQLPILDHDMPLSMLATDRGIRRFATNCIEH